MLDSDEISPDERYMVQLSERSDYAAVVNPRDQDGQEIGKQRRLLLEVECQGFVITDGGFGHFIHPEETNSYISTFAARTMTSLN
jgi:hypothetical protein